MTQYVPPAAARARAKAALLEDGIRQDGKMDSAVPTAESAAFASGPAREPISEPAPAPEPRPRPVRKARKANLMAGIGRLIAAVFGAAKRIKLPKRAPKPAKDEVIDGEAKEPGVSKTRSFFSKKNLRVAGIVLAVIVILFAVIMFIGNQGAPPPSATNLQVPDFTSPTGETVTSGLPDQTGQPDASQLLPSIESAQPASGPLTVRTPADSLNLDFKVPLLSLALAALFILSLFESSAQGDYILLDFFSAWGMLTILVLGQIYGHEQSWFWAFFGAGAFAVIIATVWNPSEENESKWYNKIDTTHIYVLGLALLFLYLMDSPSLPYPEFVPIIIPVLLIAVGMGKEIFRQVGASLFALAVAVIPALLQSGIAITAGFAIEVLIAAFGAHQGWITSRGTQTSANIGGRKIQFFIAWDVVLFYVAVVALVGYALYGNYIVWTISR